MNCLFCNQNSDNSKSVEHIIPESLGNKEHVLPKGLVCDNCNHYFANKVEKPLLEQPYFRNVRHRAGIESKKGRVPIENAIIISPELAKANIIYDYKENTTSILIEDEEKAKRIFSSSKGSMIIPAFDKPKKDNRIISRFLAKIAVEGLLHWLLDEKGWIEEVMTSPALDDIKKYARYGQGIELWPYHERRIYSEETRFNNPLIQIENYEILHEFKILVTKEDHYYFVLAIMGIEYAINIGGPGIDSYEKWLKENNYASILDDKNERKSCR